LKTLHQWHWISSALCLLGMLLFAITGLTLNNAGLIESKAAVVSRHASLPDALRTDLAQQAQRHGRDKTPLPDEAVNWLAVQLDVQARDKPAEWSADEIYLSLPRAGGDAWLSLNLATGEVEHELTDRGWIAYLNDLHKGRNTGKAWSWFIDAFAVACLVFSLTGLLLLKMHAGRRMATWPMVGLGLLIPLVLTLLFIH
jgi:hypothetical protein